MKEQNQTFESSFENYKSIAAKKGKYPKYELSAEEIDSKKYDKDRFNRYLQNVVYPYEKKWENDLIEAAKAIVPEVGVKCTINYWSDHRAATVTKVVSKSTIEVSLNKVECLDYYAGDYNILDDIDTNFKTKTFTKRSNGVWVERGSSSKDGVTLSLTHQYHYIDPSF